MIGSDNMEPVRWGILCTGNIAHAFCDATTALHQIRVCLPKLRIYFSTST